MRLRAYLVSLALATLLPVALFAAVVVYFLVKEQRDTFRRGAEARTLAVSTAVDAELNGSIATLLALSTLPALDNGDFAAFRVRAERILATQPAWSNINLAMPSGQQVMNLQRPPGVTLPDSSQFDADWQDAVERRAPVVSDLVVSPITGQWDYAVRVPVLRDGAVRFVLSAVVKPESLSKLLQAQNIPGSWVGVVLDRGGRIVARTANPEGTVGQPASQSLREALTRASSGWFPGRTIENTAVYTPYRRSAASGWVFAMGIPASTVNAVAWRGIALLVAGLLGAIALAIALARVVGRRLSAPIAELARTSEALGRGEPARVPDTAQVRELRVLAQTFQSCIDAMREREDRLRMALDAGRMGTWEWNVRTGAVIWSQDLEAIHGMAPGTFGGTLAAFEKDVHPDDVEKVRRAVAQNFESGNAEHHVEYRIVRPDGTLRWVEGRGKVFRDASGVPVRLIGVCTDVTDRKRAEEALKDADRAKDEFLAMLSHELRNPLAALTTAAHLLHAAEPGGAAAAHARDVVERQTKHMSRLVDDLLDVSRVTMGKLALEREVLDLASMVSGVVQAWRSAGRFAAHSVKADCTPVWVYADRVRIEQIVTNLLHNALKFTPAGGTISLSVEENEGEAVLRVSDSGRGIAPQALGRMFEPFVQAEDSPHGSEAGLGLGLALVKRLAELHAGSASAHSDGLGRGASFTVRLAAIAPPHDTQSAVANAEPVAVLRRMSR